MDQQTVRSTNTERSSLSSPPSNRVEWIDIAKGVGIVLVSFGHLRNGDGQSVWLPALDGLISAIYLFHMPLFYLLGGLTFSMRGGFRSFLLRKVRTLLVPYYVFSLYFLAKPFAILFIPSMRTAFQTTHNYDIAHQFYDVLIAGNGLWFLMAFFVAEIIMYGIMSITRGNIFALSATGCLFITFSYVRTELLQDFVLPFQLLQGVGIAGFMCIGFVLKSQLKHMRRSAALIAGGIGFIALSAVSVYVITQSIPSSVLWLAGICAATIGAFAVIFLCIAMRSCDILSAIGRNSLVYYALNALTLNIVKFSVFRVLHINMTTWPLVFQMGGGIVLTTIALALLYVENLFVQRFMRWTVSQS